MSAARQHRHLLPLFVLLGTTFSCGVIAPVVSVELPAVSAPPPAVVAVEAPLPLAEVEAAHARIERYQRRSGLTADERRALAETVVREAVRHDLEPELVLAVMHVESLFDTYAVSEADAMGLMQILPSTGEWMAAQQGIPWEGPQTLFDPETNVRLGAAYLRLLLDRYDSLAPALAAYNWGPGHIDRRIRRGRPLPTEYPGLVLAAYGAAGSS